MLTKRPTLTKHFYLRHSFNKKYDGNSELMHYLSFLILNILGGHYIILVGLDETLSV